MERKEANTSVRRNLVVIADLHAGCQMGLCPLSGALLDNGGRYIPNNSQKKVYEWWQAFWAEWVPMVTRGDPFAVVCNGDAIDGRHHNSTTQITHNLASQTRIAEELLAPIVELCGGQYYHIRGTEAHVGPAGEAEEQLAQRLGAKPNEEGQHARWELWARLGGEAGPLVHISHHIGTTGSMHYESTALMKEFSEACIEAARWGDEPPAVVCRSHRHRNAEVRVQTSRGFATSCTTGGWQLKTPYAYRIPGGRQSRPQIGGTLIRRGDEDVFTRHKIWSLSRPKVEVL